MIHPNSLSKRLRRFVLFCLFALFSTIAAVSWMSAVSAHDGGQSVSISGPGAAAFNQSVFYEIQYSNVAETGGIEYTFPSGFTVTGTTPPNSNQSGSTLAWDFATIGASGTITIDGVYDVSPCTSGDTVHLVEMVDTHAPPDLPLPSDSVTTTLYCLDDLGTVSGVVFEDFNGNGSQDTGEGGIAGVSITLDGSTTTTTNASGEYQFIDALPGAHEVVETNLSGYFSTTPDTVNVSVPVAGNATADFGDQPQGTVSGTVFEDLNGNGTQDAGEPGISGVVVTLSGDGTETTDANGNYQFTAVTTGNYDVSADVSAAGYAPTTPTIVPVVVPLNGSATASFGGQEQGTVSGTVFDDLNGDGTQDDGELGISGVVVTLSGVGSETTDADGNYQFTAVPSNDDGYDVSADVTTQGYVPTTASVVHISLPANGSATANFGGQLQGTISGTVFNDTNGNGSQDDGEVGLGGVTVAVSGNGTQTTDDDGNYQFTGITVGTYTIEESDPAGFISTTPNSVVVSVPTNSSATANFGDQATGTVSGVVFNDTNGNGVQDDGENGIGGVSVELIDSDGNSTSITTVSNGGYSFSDVIEGAYTVFETDPDGYVSTTLNVVPISVALGGSATANFGDQLTGLVSGTVFNDTNGNGTQDEGEDGIGGVTINLATGFNQRTGLNQTTTGDGSYSFTGVTAGTYTVIEDDPDGFSSTTSNNVPVSVAANGSATASFGDQQVGTIGGVVFEDTNGDGTPAPAETGIGGVTVQLMQDTTILQSTTTVGDGTYLFSGVTEGAYTVKETDPDGFASTSSNEVAVSIAAGGSASASFGDKPIGTISGAVFFDINSNGSQDLAEFGIGGVLISLDLEGSTTMTTTTSGDGSYSFSDVDVGTYTVIESDPAGLISVTPNEVVVSVATGGSATASFGDQLAGTISGVVYFDFNANGVQDDESELGIGAGLVQLKVGNTVVAQTLSAIGWGNYIFVGVPAGAYTVVGPSVSEASILNPTSPASVNVSVPAGGSASASFGYQPEGTVGGTVFNDVNGDGEEGITEAGIGGVEVTLDGNSTTTYADGLYLFFGVSPGEYTIEEIDPAGFVSITPNQALVSLALNGSATANFADQQQGIVSGVVFLDANGNGAQDAGESGIGGVEVTLDATPTTTSGDGSYAFTGVSAGTYTVAETNPSGFVSTTPDSRTVSVAPGGSATANFGDKQQGTVSGVVFNDVNSNGTQNTGEPGIGGVLITLSNGTTMTTTTSGDGNYNFAGVDVGTYSIVESDPAGFVSTTPNSRIVSVPANGTASASFGDQAQGLVSGEVYNDYNGNSIRDFGEPGLGGVLIELDDGTTAMTATTTINGVYQFNDVNPNVYLVEETDPAGFDSVTPNIVTVAVNPGGSASASFGDQPEGTISGLVFDDQNGDGIFQDGSEFGIGGVVVALTESMVTTTSGDGTYQFTQLAIGSYNVTMTNPDGFTDSTSNPVLVILTGENSSASANFGLVPELEPGRGGIAGNVCNDLNGGGSCDFGEGGFGATLILEPTFPLRHQLGFENTVSVGEDGGYAFTNVPTGTYQLQLDAPEGVLPTTPLIIPVAILDQQFSSVDFGLVSENSVSGATFLDLDGDGVQSTLESGLGGITVTLQSSGTMVDVTTTSADGTYQFDDIDSNTDYNAVIEVPAGLVPTTDTDQEIAPADAANFGLQNAGTLSGVVFRDQNNNSLLDETEVGLGGALITLSGGSLTRPMTTTSTVNGIYQFFGLTAGTYTVMETDLAGFVSTNNSVDITLATNDSASVNFGDRVLGRIGGVVFNDINDNGVKDSGEPGFGGATIELRDASNALIDSKTALGSGGYEFLNQSNGDYTVVVVPPPDFIATTAEEVSATVSDTNSPVANFGLRSESVITSVSLASFSGRISGAAGLILPLLLLVLLVFATTLKLWRTKLL